MVLRIPIPMTPDGHRRLVEELKKLKSVDRPLNVADIERARALGDLSENAEYNAAKEKQAHIARRIMEVENRIAQAQIIDPSTLNHAKIVFGARVQLSDAASREKIEYQIVGADEADVKVKKISVDSPLARALIGKQPGDRVTVLTPRGAREFEILEVKYE